MAYTYSSDHVRIAPDRSRSRDDPMWQNRSQHRRRQYRDAWRDVHQYVNLEESWSLSTLKQYVHSWRQLMMMSWTQQPANSCLLSVDLKSMPCSPTMFWSIHVMSRHSRWTSYSTTSASTSYIPWTATWNLPPWIFVGKTARATPLPFAMSWPCLNSSMNFVLTGLRAKSLGSCCRRKFGASLHLLSHTSCVWVAMRHSQTETCFHKSHREKVRCACFSTPLIP